MQICLLDFPGKRSTKDVSGAFPDVEENRIGPTFQKISRCVSLKSQLNPRRDQIGFPDTVFSPIEIYRTSKRLHILTVKNAFRCLYQLSVST